MSEDAQKMPWSLSRRSLFVAGAYGATSLAIGVGQKARWHTENVSPYLDRVVINGVNIWACVSEHDRGAWERSSEFWEKAAVAADVVIPAYFPSEYAHLRSDPQLGRAIRAYDDLNYAFEKLEEMTERKKKDVWVVDPAYDKTFGLTTAGIHIGELAVKMYASFTGVMGLAHYRQVKPTAEERQQGRSYSRRAVTRAAVGAAFLAATTGGSATAGFPIQTILELRYRQSMVAQHVANLCRSGRFEPGTVVMMFYPQNHWIENGNSPGIKRYLQNDAEREATVDFFNVAVSDEVGPSLARHFPDGTFTQNREVVKLGEGRGGVERSVALP